MKESKSPPPRLFLRFFEWFCHPDIKKYVEGDLIELYHERLQKLGKRKADLLFSIDVLLLFRPGIIKPLQGFRTVNNYPMYKSYFKIGWRNLVKNKGYSIINIGGLAAGMTVTLLIGLWISDEVSFNRQHENYDTIAKVYRKETGRGGIHTNSAHVTGLGTLLKTEYGSYFKNVAMVRARPEGRVISFDDKKFTQTGYFMQPEGAEMFSLKMKYGTRNGLKEKKSILLSESLATKLFGDTDPVNRMVRMDAKWDLEITGVFQDLPKNSEFNGATFFAPLDLYLDGWATLNAWDNYHMIIYVQINPDGDFDKISSIIKDAVLPHVDHETAKLKPELFLHPMSKWHLHSQFENGVSVTSERMKFVRFYGVIGILVLILACINFMNLSTARSEKRAREVGIRKSIGSLRRQLVHQFFSESLLVAFFSFILSLLAVQVSLDWFNRIADKDITMPLTSPVFWMASLSFTIFTGLLAGIYPALYLSSFNPIQVLKGTYKGGATALLPRRVLVIIQFTVSISLVIGTISVYKQIEYAKNRPVGYSRAGLIELQPMSPEYSGKYHVLRNELKKTGVVEEIAESNYSIANTLGWNGGFAWRGQTFDASFNTIFVTHEYGRTIGWELIEGRDFSRDFNDKSGIVINESALKIMGLQNPVGEQLTWTPGWTAGGTFTILGVVKDMVKGSPFEPTQPSIIFVSENDLAWLYIKIKPSVSAHDALPEIHKAFTSIVPSAPFDYRFADEVYAEKFRSEERVGKLAGIFSLLAVLISCSGLFGLASFVAEQRTKEIGIRKIMGASIANLWRMLTGEFVRLVIISCVIAIPISFYFMDKWLMQYAYRMQVSWIVFASAVIGALIVTLLTVSYQAIRAAMTNPVESLRSE